MYRITKALDLKELGTPMHFKNLYLQISLAVIAAASCVQVFAAGNVIPPITNSEGEVYGYSYKAPQSEVPVARQNSEIAPVVRDNSNIGSADVMPDRPPYDAGSRTPEKAVSPPTGDGIPLPAGSQEEQDNGRTQSILSVAIRSKYNKKAQDHMIVYPSPQLPPRVKTEIGPLATDRSNLKQMLLQSGYQDRLSLDHPYPMYGMRWHTAFQAALKNSKMGVPHTMFDYYPWINKMVDYIRPEVIKINAHEKARKDAYLKAVFFYQEEAREAENEAVRNNYSPLAFTPKKDSTGTYWRGEIPAGNWWITATRKTPGLQFYWQIPITVAPGQSPSVVLNEDNALWIQGGW